MPLWKQIGRSAPRFARCSRALIASLLAAFAMSSIPAATQASWIIQLPPSTSALDAMAQPPISQPILGSEPARKVDAKKPGTKVTTGLASYYGRGFHGKKTANGEIFNKYAMTAAHPTIPLGTKARVVNLKNGKSVAVLITDRGPVKRRQRAGVIIDLSEGAGAKLGMLHDGLVKVQVEVPTVLRTAKY